MARSRHKHVLRPHRRLTRIGLAAAAVLAVGAPAVAVVWPDEEPVDATPVERADSEKARTSAVSMRVATPAGAEDLVELVASPSATPDPRGKSLGRTRRSGKAQPVDRPTSSAAVEVTGRTRGEWAEVVVGEKRIWVRESAIARTVAPETTSTQTNAKRSTGTDTEASPVLEVTTTTVKAVSAAQPTTTGTSPTAAPTPVTASEPVPVATSTPTVIATEEPAPEPTPVLESPTPTVAAETCDVTTNGRAVGLHRQLCDLP